MSRRTLFVGALAVGLFAGGASRAATKTLDLDGNPANGAESQCDLNVLQTFPVMVENRVTNRSSGDAFSFVWPSAGPGGFISSITPGTTGGVGAKWVWTTNQSVFSYTGTSCANDVCFVQTGGPDQLPSTCSAGCFDDGVFVSLQRGTSGAEMVLSWPSGQGPFTVFRSTSAATITNAGNALSTTDLHLFTDVPPAGSIFFYKVQGTGCVSRRPCATDADCNPATEGTCASRGPFGVPGRSLLATSVTVSSASLTSSLITFFSPPVEVFRATNSVAPVATGISFQQGLFNASNVGVTAIVGAYPPGCCNEPNQLNCSGTCVDFLTDAANCGACGNDCGEGYHCDDGQCRITCSGDTFDCEGVCVDLENDRNNCGACGNACDGHSACISSVCYECYGPNDVICDNTCVDLGSDPHHCGGCEVDCDAFCEAPLVGACDKEVGCFCVEPGGVVNSQPGVMVPSAPVTRASAPRPATPSVEAAPICELQSSTTFVPAGATITSCRLENVLAKEVPTSIAICGEGIPDGNARCPNGDPATQGTFMKLIPDLTRPIGDAFVTPLAVHITDTSNDGLIQAHEVVHVVIEVLNAGPFNIEGATGTLLSPPVDLTDDGVDNPVAVTISSLAESFGDIIGTPPGEGDCNAPRRPLEPAKNAVPFEVTFGDHPGDTSRLFTLQLAGIVNNSPFSMDMPISLGIADACVFAENTRDFDGLDGLLSPMAKLVPIGDDIPLPEKNFKVSFVLPLEVRQLCGGVDLSDENVDPPQITGLSEAKLGDLDITALILNDDTGTNDPFFRWDGDLGRWIYHLRTAGLEEGRYTLRVRIASRKEYNAGFILESED